MTTLFLNQGRRIRRLLPVILMAIALPVFASSPLFPPQQAMPEKPSPLLMASANTKPTLSSEQERLKPGALLATPTSGAERELLLVDQKPLYDWKRPEIHNRRHKVKGPWRIPVSVTCPKAHLEPNEQHLCISQVYINSFISAKEDVKPSAPGTLESVITFAGSNNSIVSRHASINVSGYGKNPQGKLRFLGNDFINLDIVDRDTTAPTVEWVKPFRAGETLYLTDDKVKVRFKTYDDQSGLHTLHLRYGPTGDPQWQNASLYVDPYTTRSGEIESAIEITLKRGVTYTLQAWAEDWAGNQSAWGDLAYVEVLPKFEPTLSWYDAMKTGPDNINWVTTGSPTVYAEAYSAIGFRWGYLDFFSDKSNRVRFWSEGEQHNEATREPVQYWNMAGTELQEGVTYRLQGTVKDYYDQDASTSDDPQKQPYMQFDGTPPTVAWQGSLSANKTDIIADKPYTVFVASTDHGSGVQGGTLRYGETGGAGWQYASLLPEGAAVNGRQRLKATLTVPPGKTYTLQAFTRDRAGLESGWSDLRYVKVDVLPPVANFVPASSTAEVEMTVTRGKALSAPSALILDRPPEAADTGLPVAVAGEDFSLASNPGYAKNHQLDASASRNATGYLWQVIDGAQPFWLSDKPGGGWYKHSRVPQPQAVIPENAEGKATYRLTAFGPDLNDKKTHYLTFPTLGVLTQVTDDLSGVKTGELYWRTTEGGRWQKTAMEPAGDLWKSTLTLQPDRLYQVVAGGTDNVSNSIDVSRAEPARVWYKAQPPRLSWQGEQPVQISPAGIQVRGRVQDSVPEHLTSGVEYREQGSSVWQFKSVTPDEKGFFSLTFAVADRKVWEVRLTATDVTGRQVVNEPLITGTLLQHLSLSSTLDDRDASGGATPGDGVELKLRIESAADLDRLSARLQLPAGLEVDPRSPAPIVLDVESDYDRDNVSSVAARLNLQWNGADNASLVRTGDDAPTLRRGDVIILRMPLVIGAEASGTLNSEVTLGLRDQAGEYAASHAVTLQTGGFPAAQALQTGISSPTVMPGSTLPLGTPFEYRMTLRAHTWPLSGAQLTYALPRYLHKDRGDIHVVAAESNVSPAINPQWEGRQDTRLLAEGGVLRPGEHLTLAVPVRLDATTGAELKSIVTATAENVTGEQKDIHCVYAEVGDVFVTFSLCGMPFTPRPE